MLTKDESIGHDLPDAGIDDVPVAYQSSSNSHYDEKPDLKAEGSSVQILAHPIVKFVATVLVMGSVLLSLFVSWVYALGAPQFAQIEMLGQQNIFETLHLVMGITVASLCFYIVVLTANFDFYARRLKDCASNARDRLSTLEMFGRDVVGMFDDVGELIEISDVASRQLGANAESLQGYGFFHTLHLLDRPLYLKTLSDCSRKKNQAVIEIRSNLRESNDLGQTQNYRRYKLSIYPLKEQDGSYLAICISDIEHEFNERKRVIDVKSRNLVLEDTFTGTIDKAQTSLEKLRKHLEKAEEIYAVRDSQKDTSDKESHTNFIKKIFRQTNDLDKQLEDARCQIDEEDPSIELVKLDELVKVLVSQRIKSAQILRMGFDINIPSDLPDLQAHKPSLESLVSHILTLLDDDSFYLKSAEFTAAKHGQGIALSMARLWKRNAPQNYTNDQVELEKLSYLAESLGATLTVKNTLSRGQVIQVVIPRKSASAKKVTAPAGNIVHPAKHQKAADDATKDNFLNVVTTLSSGSASNGEDTGMNLDQQMTYLKEQLQK